MSKIPSFVLSPHFEIKDVEEMSLVNNNDLLEEEEADIKRVKAGELFILNNNRKGRIMLIPPTMKFFLEAFQQPVTLKSVIEDFAEKVQCNPRQIGQKMVDFFHDMHMRDILVTPELAEKIAVDVERESIFEEGQLIDNYKIIDTIIEKSRVELYLAEDLHTKEQVVIKTLYLASALNARRRKKRRKNFHQEFDLMQELQDHASICKFHKYVETKDLSFAVMEYVEGQSLRRHLKNVQPNLAGRLDLMRQLLEAMAYMHRVGILHGDLHASNFIIQTKDEKTTLRVIDFDLSNHKKLQVGESKRQGGVHEYIPPECLSNNAFDVVARRADYRSEGYQIGVILYQILYGKFPHRAVTWKGLVDKIKNQPPELNAQTEAGEEIPQEVLDFLKKVLAKKRKDRFKSGKKMVKAWRKLEL